MENKKSKSLLISISKLAPHFILSVCIFSNSLSASLLQKTLRMMPRSTSTYSHLLNKPTQYGAVNSAFRNFSEQRNLPDEDKENSEELSTAITKPQADLFRSLLQKEFQDFKYELKQDGPWDIHYARQQIIEQFIEQGYSKQEALERFKNFDNEIDKKRLTWNLPYMSGIAITALGIPATWALVYNQEFYGKILEIWPWLNETSWDWSEPIVQSLLTTQTGSALILASIGALGFRPYSKYRNTQLTKKAIQGWDIPKKTAEKFIKVDR